MSKKIKYRIKSRDEVAKIVVPEIYYSKENQTQSIISRDCIVTLSTGEEIQGYYHLIYGWMTKKEPNENWIYGYQPINSPVIKWKYL